MTSTHQVRKVYLYAVFGALGGLLASYLHQHLLLDSLSAGLSPGLRKACEALEGLVVGAAIGLVPGGLEGLEYYAWRGALRRALAGAALGGLGGMAAMPLCEMLHRYWFRGGYAGRMAGLAVLGMAIGLAEGLNGGARRWRGMAGGLLGGAAGGLMLETGLRLQATYAAAGVVSLILVGFSVALLIALFVNVLSEAWLEGLPGSKVTGNLYHLGKFREPHEAVVGCDTKGGVFIWVPDAQPRHAALVLTRQGVRLRHLAPGGTTYVNGSPVQQHLLRDQDIVQVGGARLRYRESRRTALAPAKTA